MTAKEIVDQFNNGFDLLWNNISSDQAPGLSGYEKSMFLTKAQNELVKNYAIPNSRGNSVGMGFDESAIRQMDFSNITLSETKELAASSTVIADPRELVCDFPDKVYFIINEQILLQNSSTATPSQRQVIPVSFQEYMRLMSKPFKEPLKSQAWRLITNNESANKISIILTSADKKYTTKRYFIRYVKKPVPIILEDLSQYGDIKIDGMSDISACELNESTWDAILQRAVELAKIAWNSDANETQLQITSGQRSE